MQPKAFLTTIIVLLISFAAQAQVQNHNPYKDIGKKGKVLTLTNGKYEEFFDDDSLQRIGTALININTMKVVKLQMTDDEQRIIDNSASTKFLSVDPLSYTYPWYSPYQYAGNTPIQAIDLDGLEEYIVAKELFRSGATKKITVQYTVQKDDVTKKVNVHFREVLKANPDGTVELGGYLTDQRVIRVTIDANGNRSYSPDDNLTKQEQAIVDQKSTNENPTDPEKDMWDMTVNKAAYNSETVRNTEIMQDKIAEKKFAYSPPAFEHTPLQHNSVLSNFNGSSNYFYGTSTFSGGGQLGNDLISSLNVLAGQLQKAENIKSITINLNQGVGSSIGSTEYNIAQQYGQTAVANVVTLLQSKLKGTGIKVNVGVTKTVPHATNSDLKNNNQAVGVNIKIN